MKVCQIVIEVEFGIYKEILLIKGDSSLILYKLISQYSTQDFCQTRQKYIKLKCHWYDIIEVVEFGINKGGNHLLFGQEYLPNSVEVYHADMSLV